ncbi:hypothetical protein A1O7_06603 [Cladophialophora yegresii CBS 114405]|uniref:Uncharacterized protein n=1 Tax=Cladophialophora yegresii CBS 114405 TaxID=1182544 RepID=W9W3Q6_9EURO|nr:uncharacterized protein A1O7_06603 [Cladophialophora yegresii CBS 114405]EXJ59171.1 hypothetical protein A1O7_06603 [Cladophialophora yegresii CBS 114405]
MTPPTHWNEVLEIAADAPPKNPDCIVTLGAGPFTDAVKVICWALANGITTSEGPGGAVDVLLVIRPRKHWVPVQGFRHLPRRHPREPLRRCEYQSTAGLTRDDGTHAKVLFQTPTRNPNIVVLDPGIVALTPREDLAQHGLHPNAKGDGEAENGSLRLVPALITTHQHPDDPGRAGTRPSMRGVVEAMSAVGSGVPLGASHAIIRPPIGPRWARATARRDQLYLVAGRVEVE